MNVYSNDLRMKIVSAYIDTMASYQQLSSNFGVSVSMIYRLMKRYKQTCSIEPKSPGGGQFSLINDEGLDKLQKLIEQNPDAILEELCEIFEKDYQIKVSTTTIWRALQRLNYTRKKNFPPSKARH